MLTHRQLLRLGAWLTTSSLCLTTLAPAVAQPAPPPGADQAGEQGTDPPAVAGRLAAVTGSVSFHGAGETQWNGAALNYPVTNGEAFWTEPQASATLEIADSRVVMDDSTELDITALDQNTLAATEAQGAIFLQLNSLPSAQGVSFNTPRGTVQISAIGRYEIVAGDTNDATTVTVVEGSAHVSGNNLSLDIGPQQTATIGGTDTLAGNVGPMQQDTFLQAQLGLQRNRPRAALPPQVRYMTGASDLQQYGSFSQSAQYGQVWYPNDVANGWAPYRDGHWAYVQPWGWTWVDNARWGFAPFHYGRWVQVEDRWGWVAGEEAEAEGSPYPVYSPALVSFVDVGGAALAGVAIGFGAAELAGGYAPGWIPLGPREPYYPWYHCRADYFGRINRPYGVPRDIIARGPTYINNVTINRTNVFINRRGAAVSPAGAFARGQSMMGIARPLPERALAEARPVGARLPVRPTAFTPNLAPAAARRFDVALPRTPVRPVTAGPRIVPPAARGAVPELRRAALPANVRGVPAAGVQARPPGAGPAGGLRQPGATIPARGAEPLGATPHVGAPAPQIGTRGPGGLPALRAPGARPQAIPPGGAPIERQRGGEAPSGRMPDAARPPSEPGVRPGEEARTPTGSRPGQPPRAAPLPRVQEPTAVPHSQEARPPAREQASRPEPRVEAPRPQPHAEAPRPARRSEAPRPSSSIPRVERPSPPPRMEAPRPAPRTEAPRPAPRMQAPRPEPRPAPAPRPAAPHPAPGRPEPRH